MDLAPLPVRGSHSHDHTVSHQLPSADSPPTVFSTFAPRQRTSDLPGKVIGQRLVHRCDAGLDTEYSGAHGFAASVHDSADGEHVDVADRQPQMPEQEDGDSSWQVVTRRRLRSKRHKTEAVASGGRCGDTRVENSACEKSVSAGQLPETSSADREVTGQNQRLQPWRNDSISLSSHASCWYWPLCLNSFARLSKVDWTAFHAVMEKFLNRYRQIRVKRDDFLYFHHMMTEGPQAISRAGDAVFLVNPFKVLMSGDVWSSDALLLSLLFDRAVPGFLIMLGDRFVNSLTGINPKHNRLFRAITELLIRMCQEDEHWLNRLGWQKLSLRNQCNLFSSIALLFKHSNEQDLIRSLQQQVSGSWLEKHYYATVERISCNTEYKDPKGDLLDLRANLRAVFSWLEAQIFSVGKPKERPELIVRYANICDALLVAIHSLAPPPSALLHSVWLAVAQVSHRLRMYLSQYLGFDRAISLLDKLLNKIARWADLDALAFELRLSLLGFMLRKCEELTLRRNPVRFSQAWHEHEKKLELLLAECNCFMTDYQPPNAADESDYTQLKEDARLNLKLKESVFYRLDCGICRSSRQCIQENLQVCRRAFKYGWALKEAYREVGTIELAKWYFLAGEYDAGISTLTNACCKNIKMSTKKADLLARHGVYHSAVAELHHIKALMRESSETDQCERDKVDNRLAMVELQWYQAGDGTDHLVEAYRLSVGLLGRCDVRDREGFEGGLSYIVNAMKHSGLRFEDFTGQTAALGYLVKEGSRIKSWYHLANLLFIRHKHSLSSVSSVNKMADEMCVKHVNLPGQQNIVKPGVPSKSCLKTGN